MQAFDTAVKAYYYYSKAQNTWLTARNNTRLLWLSSFCSCKAIIQSINSPKCPDGSESILMALFLDNQIPRLLKDPKDLLHHIAVSLQKAESSKSCNSWPLLLSPLTKVLDPRQPLLLLCKQKKTSVIFQLSASLLSLACSSAFERQ